MSRKRRALGPAVTPTLALWLSMEGLQGRVLITALWTVASPLRLPPFLRPSHSSIWSGVPQGLLHVAVITESCWDMARKGSTAEPRAQASVGGSQTRQLHPGFIKQVLFPPCLLQPQ